MGAEFLRDAAMTAAVLGSFASAWFGWAQDDPPRSWRRPLVAGSVIHLFPVASLLQYPLVAVVAALVTVVALAAIPLARSRSLAASAVTGVATGTVLLAGASYSLVSVLLWP